MTPCACSSTSVIFFPAEHETQGNFSPLLHAHLLGRKLGAFEIVSDAAAPESLWAGQTRMKDGALFFDIWTSFAPGGVAASPVGDASIASFQIQATVHPPTLLQAATAIHLQVRRGGARTLLFELSRFLKIESVQADGRAVDFIQNPAMEGSQLRRKGNDLVALVFPAPLAAGQQLQLRFAYAGEVLSEAGTGLLYVGDRGTWYPSFGLSPARFDIEFHYPATWTLVATGKQAAIAVQPPAASAPAPAEKISRWISERPLPVAGFNLGKYLRAESRAGSIMVEAYGTKGVEKTFPKPPPEVLVDPAYPAVPPVRQLAPQLVTPPSPSPVHDLQSVADRAALAIDDFTQWFGPFPYGSLALTQMPGDLSQGWPGLVFLSSFAFLSPREQADLHLDPVSRILDSQLLVHETAHQWWGDLVQWPSYRDQWISEGLANYSSLLNLEQQNPAQFREVLDQYRSDLLADNREGERVRDAGPVTLGQRLVSSHFPKGYETIGYERGTWLFHMLRCMLRDSQPPASETLRSRKGRTNPDEPFFRTLRKIRDRYAGKSLSTQQLVEAFAEDLPRPLWYEKRPKLDWFLEDWIEGTSIPRLEAREIRITEKAGGSTVTGVIVQKDAPDDLVTAVPVYATTAGNAPVFLGEVLADGQETSFRLSAPAHIRKVELDPRQTILRSLK